MTDTLKTLPLFAESLQLTVDDRGAGAACLLIHGGAGPASMAGLGQALSAEARVVTPTHPGFAGQPRPAWLTRVNELALSYLALLEKLDLREVTLVGNSIGGWIAAEMALKQSPRVAGLVLLNACGIDTGSADKVITDPMAVPAERATLSFHDPVKFGFPPPTTPEALAMLAANQQTLRLYGGAPFMHDPGLHARLSGIRVPTLVAWGESDRIVDLDYGRRFAAGIPGAHFEVVREAGHFPQIEQRDTVLGLIRGFKRPA